MELELVVCVQYRKIIHNQPWTTIVHRISSPLSTLIVVVILGLSIQCIHSRQHTANSKLFECSLLFKKMYLQLLLNVKQQLTLTTKKHKMTQVSPIWQPPLMSESPYF